MAKSDPSTERDSARPANKRGAARLAAVQALYQMDVGETALADTLAQFGSRFAEPVVDGDEYLPRDADYFGQIVKGVLKRQLEIDPLVDQALAEGWPMARIDATMRAVMRAGTFELIYKPDVPANVVITEYVDVAKAFFEGTEAGMVNGVLDRIARNRPAEV